MGSPGMLARRALLTNTPVMVQVNWVSLRTLKIGFWFVLYVLFFLGF